MSVIQLAIYSLIDGESCIPSRAHWRGKGAGQPGVIIGVAFAARRAYFAVRHIFPHRPPDLNFRPSLTACSYDYVAMITISDPDLDVRRTLCLFKMAVSSQSSGKKVGLLIMPLLLVFLFE